MQRLFFCILFFVTVSVCYPQTFWKVENQYGEDILLTITVNRNNQTFVAHTRKDALKDIAGSITFLAAKTAGILKYPEIVHTEGKVRIVADTMIFNGTFTYLNQTLQFIGRIREDQFQGKISDNKDVSYYLKGVRIPSDKPLHDYRTIISKAFVIFEKYYFDRDFVRSSEWKSFKNKIDEVAPRIADDNELAAAVYWPKRSLPDLPFEIERLSKAVIEKSREKGIPLREVKPKTALIDLNYLPENEHEMNQLFIEIKRKGFLNLIIDARGRKKLLPYTALMFVNHLTDHRGTWGVYVTRKWTDMNLDSPKPADFVKSFKSPYLIADNKSEIHDQPGCFLQADPVADVFRGKIYMLINRKTTGTSEAMAIWMMNEKTGITVGQRSAGSPMLNGPFVIDNLYYLKVQYAQFYDKNGIAYLKNGIDPEIKTGREDALTFLLKKLE